MNGDGFISPSVVHLPTKYLSDSCSGPGFGGAGAWAAALPARMASEQRTPLVHARTRCEVIRTPLRLTELRWCDRVVGENAGDCNRFPTGFSSSILTVEYRLA